MRVLVTGSAGILGGAIADLLADSGTAVTDLRLTARQPASAEVVEWNMGHHPPPPSLRSAWDVIIHTAAATRWTMTRAEATAANIEPVEALRAIARPGTHIVHISTAYLAQRSGGRAVDGFDGYRNGYEWSKARCEDRLSSWHRGPLTFVRPPLIVGRSDTGAISRFTGPYTLLQAMVSGLAAAVVGDPDGYVEIAPVDQVAAVAVAAALAPPPTTTAQVATVAAGPNSMRLATLLDTSCHVINRIRRANGVAPIEVPPFISAARWHRFFLPFAERHMSPVQNEAVKLLGMFEQYTSMSAPFTPTHPVTEPEEVLRRSVEWWAARKPRHVLRTPTPWALVGATGER